MKLSELYDKLTTLKKNPCYNRIWEETEVVVKESRVNVGGTAVVKIMDAYMGFDWDTRKFILTPEKEMITKENNND